MSASARVERTSTGRFVTQWCAVQDLQAGDCYRFGVVGGDEEREVLALVQRTPMGGALLEVRKWPSGNVTRTRLHGRVFIVRPTDAG